MHSRIVMKFASIAWAMVVCLAATKGKVVAWASPSPSPMAAALSARAQPGGLCVQLGAEDLAIPLELARGGRFLVQVLDHDANRVARARAHIHAQGLYGLVSVDQIAGAGRLPFAENLVNVLLVRVPSVLDTAALAEIFRVLRPGGLVFLAPAASETLLKEAGFEDIAGLELAGVGGRSFVGRKPWPLAMDEWTHPRHGADGRLSPISRPALHYHAAK